MPQPRAGLLLLGDLETVKSTSYVYAYIREDGRPDVRTDSAESADDHWTISELYSAGQCVHWWLF